MKLRLALLVVALPLALALVGTQGAAASTGPEAAGAAQRPRRSASAPRPATTAAACGAARPGSSKKAEQALGSQVRAQGDRAARPRTRTAIPARAAVREADPASSPASPRSTTSRATSSTRASPTAPPGWPNCAVEERYDHCSNGSWAYHRYTPTSGSDINSYGSYTVTGAVAHPDGSWGVEYVVDAYGTQSFYSWDVAADGTVVGRYWAPGNFPPNPPNQNLGRRCSYQQPTDSPGALGRRPPPPRREPIPRAGTGAAASGACARSARARAPGARRPSPRASPRADAPASRARAAPSSRDRSSCCRRRAPPTGSAARHARRRRARRQRPRRRAAGSAPASARPTAGRGRRTAARR